MDAWTNRPMREAARRGAWKEIAVPAAHFLLGMALGAGRMFASCAPFGVAAAAAAGSGLNGLACLGGAAFGYFFAGDFFTALRYIATALAVFAVGFVTRSVSFRAQRWYMPLVAALALAASAAPYINRVSGTVPGVLRLFLDVILGGGCAYLFSLVFVPEKVLSEAAETRRTVSFTILAACALMGVSSIELFGILSIGRFLAALVVMAAGFCGGPFIGCTAGAALGLGMDLAGGAALFHCAAYALSGVLAGALYRYGRLAFTVSFCAANAVAVLLAWKSGAQIASLYECFAASVVFLLLPQAALAPVGSLLHVGRGRGETTFRLYQADRLTRLADGFSRLYDSADRPAPLPDASKEMGSVFTRAADLVCRSCAGRDQCWVKDREETVRCLSSLSEEMARRGAVGTNDLPVSFRQRCVAPGAFAGALNGELRGYMYRRQYAARLNEGRAAAYGQFLDMADVLRGAAAELSGPAGPDTQAERRLIRYLKARELEVSCSVFRDGRGRLHAAVDGPDVRALVEEPDYLERLSDALGVRLCRVSPDDAGRVLLRQAEPLAVSVGVASTKKDGETVSGDRGTFFKTDSGYMCVILSDGMGTGEAAAAESAASVGILENLLRAGVEPGCAMRLLNASAMLRNGDEWGYATVDLCCIDLFTGETAFYKYGAAPSFVKTGRAVRRIRSTSLAAGMLAGDNAAPDRVRVRLRPGSIALIASDGVLAEKQDQWLRDILLTSDGVETKDVALKALRAAAARFGHADDMTALVLRVEERQ